MLVFSFLLLIPSSPFPTPPQLINQGLIYLPSIPTALSLWRPYTKVMLTSELELLLQGQSPSLMPRLSLGDYTRDKVFSPSLCTSVHRQDCHFPSYISPPSLSLPRLYLSPPDGCFKTEVSSKAVASWQKGFGKPWWDGRKTILHLATD